MLTSTTNPILKAFTEDGVSVRDAWIVMSDISSYLYDGDVASMWLAGIIGTPWGYADVDRWQRQTAESLIHAQRVLGKFVQVYTKED